MLREPPRPEVEQAGQGINRLCNREGLTFRLLSATDHYLVLKVKVECAHTSENNINPLCRNPCGLPWAPGEFHFSLYLCLPSGLSGLSHTCSLQPGNQGL